MVVGSFVKLGNTLATDVKMIDVETKKLIQAASSKGLGEQSILDFQIDQLSSVISQAAGSHKQGISETIKPVREVTTVSMEAYKYYVMGREEIGRDNLKATQFLGKAIEIDADFGLAYSELGFSYYLSGKNKKAIKAIQRAKELAV